MTTQKWTEDRVATLIELAGPNGSEVSRETVAKAAEALEVTERSITSKLAKIDGYSYTIEKAETKKAFTDEEGAALQAFVQNNPNTYTYAEIAELFADGKFSAKAVQGKVLALKLTDLVNKAEKAATVKTYTDEEEAVLVAASEEGVSLETAAERVGKSLQSVRGKFLSLFKEGRVKGIPVQANKAPEKEDIFEGLDVANLTVDEIVGELAAKDIIKTARGIKTTLTRRGISAKDYTAKAKKAD